MRHVALAWHRVTVVIGAMVVVALVRAILGLAFPVALSTLAPVAILTLLGSIPFRSLRNATSERLYCAIVAACVLASMSLTPFHTSLARRHGPVTLAFAFAAIAIVFGALARSALARGTTRRGAIILVATGAMALLLEHVRPFVWYARIHVLFELVTFVTWTAAAWVILTPLARSSRIRLALGVQSGVALLSIIVALVSSRRPIEGQPIHPDWEIRTSMQATEEPPFDFDVIVFFVDTLRRDVALDPTVMPHVAGFAKESIAFTNAYGAGSDTLRSLPAILSCRYDSDLHRAPLLDAVRRSGATPIVFIPDSAAEFLHDLYPGFAFDETRRFADHDAGRRVFGYGANRSTALVLADEAARRIESFRDRDRRVFAWIHNFDVHNWADLDGDYIDRIASEHQLPADHALPLRYRAAARGVDAAFGRLLAFLDAGGRRDRTVIILTSDHGEALGREGFWMHGTFLWEALVRVPLFVRIPNEEPRSIDRVVSLVDVWPTLQPFIGAPDAPCHGRSAFASENEERPILLTAAQDGTIVRTGLVTRDHKIVLGAIDQAAELFDLHADDPDRQGVDHPSIEATLLGELHHSPIGRR